MIRTISLRSSKNRKITRALENTYEITGAGDVARQEANRKRLSLGVMQRPFLGQSGPLRFECGPAASDPKRTSLSFNRGRAF